MSTRNQFASSLWNGIDPALVGRWAGGVSRRRESHERVMGALEDLSAHPGAVTAGLAAIGRGRVSDPSPLPITPETPAIVQANDNRPLAPIGARPRQATPVQRERRGVSEMVLAFAGGPVREKVGA
jgi:hypothetical protein